MSKLNSDKITKIDLQSPKLSQQEAQLMLTTGSTRLAAVEVNNYGSLFLRYSMSKKCRDVS